jgi:hypothetical protein
MRRRVHLLEGKETHLSRLTVDRVGPMGDR